jgi:hypothetical protein
MAATAGSGTAAQAIMLRQLLNGSKAIRDTHKANNDLRRSRQIKAMVRTQLVMVARALPPVQAKPPATAGNPTPAPAVPPGMQEHERIRRTGRGCRNDAPRLTTAARIGEELARAQEKNLRVKPQQPRTKRDAN